MQTNTRKPGYLLRNAGIFNPVLVQAVGLCPVVAMATTLKGAALLAGVAAVIITVSELMASMFFKVIPRWVRIGLYIIIGGGLITPVMLWLQKFNSQLFGTLGIYLPVMAVNSLLVLRCERFAVKIKPLGAVTDGLTASLGYAAVLIVVGALREVLGSGSIAGYKFWNGRTLTGLLLPFGGFLMIGYAAAALRAFIATYWPKYLDKKQPKPGEKKHHSQKKPRPVVSAESLLPNLEADDTMATLEEMGISDFQTEGDNSEQPAVQIESESVAQLQVKAVEKPEENSSETETESAVKNEENTAENPTENIVRTEEKSEEKSEDFAPAPSAETASESSPESELRELTLDDVLTEDTKPADKKSEKKAEMTVEDDELETLLNRSTDEIIGKKKKEGDEE